MDRRKFIQKTGTATVGVCCLGTTVLMSSCTKIIYVSQSISDKQIRVSLSEFKESSFVIVQNDQLPAPIYLTRTGEKFSAFSMLCTHRQCVLDAAGDLMICPCHGSEFSNKGKVLSPPASQNLDTYPVTLVDRTVIIELP